MHTRVFRFRSIVPFVFVMLLMVPMAAQADVCEYTLYSKWTKRTMPVCEIPMDDTQPCGTFLKPESDKDRHAIASGNVSKTAATCSNMDNIVGICVLSSTRLAFFDGDPGILEIGCANMKGTWRVLSIAEKRDVSQSDNVQALRSLQ